MHNRRVGAGQSAGEAGGWSFPGEYAERVGYPAAFPEELPRRLIKLLSFPGDLVIDPFVGSGTTAVVTRSLGRRFWGCDRNPTAVARAQTRLEGTGICARVERCLPRRSRHSYVAGYRFYLGSAVGMPLMGRLADRFGPRTIFCLGLVIVGLTGVLAPLAPVFGWLFAFRRRAGHLHGKRAGGGGLFQTFRYVGAILSTAVIRLVFGAGASSASLHQLALIAAVLSGLLVLASTLHEPG